MQWQHGTYEKLTNRSLVLTPFGVDGRQLLSNPCQYQQAILTRYTQPELFLVRSFPDRSSSPTLIWGVC
jgi:hypothetical protein